MTDRLENTNAAETPGTARRLRLGRIAAAAAAGLLGLGVVVVGVAATGTAVAGDLTAGSDASAGTWGFGDHDGGRHGHGGPGMMGDRMGGPGGHVADAATALGITTDELVTELRAGKSIADVATAKGVSIDTVVTAIVAAEKREIADAVTAGRLTQAQADELLATVEQHATDIVNRTPPARDGSAGTFGMGGRHGDRHGDRHGVGGPGGFGNGMADELAVVAKTLGITTDELATKLMAGTTIASIAADENVAVDTVVAALVAHEQEELAAAVADGKLTQAEADRMATMLEQRVTDQVNGTFRGPRGHHGGFPDGTSGTGTGTSTNG